MSLSERELFAVLGPAFRGAGFIAGTVTVDSVPSPRSVELRSRPQRTCVLSMTSAVDGSFRFDGVQPGVLFDVIGRDVTATYEDVIVGGVTPVAY